MLTVISWFSARRSRKALHELVGALLTDKPTLVALVSDHYTSETSLRPWVPLSERFGERLDLILAAEWEQKEREHDGQLLWRQLGVAVEAWPRLLHDTGASRTALLLRQRRPYALIDLFFLEKGRPYSESTPDPREPAVQAEEDALAAQLERLLGRMPPPEPPPIRPLQPGEHDFSGAGVCHACGDGRASLRLCPGRKPIDEPRRDRFELIELD